LADRLRFPFRARCLVQRSTSPLEVGDEVEVIAMGSDEDCEHEMFVSIRWKRRPLAVPLAQLEGLQVDEETDQAIQDWRYWVTQGYTL
jgi:Calcium binding